MKPTDIPTEIRMKVRKNLDPYFLKFCTLEAIEDIPIDTKKILYYYLIENIIMYIYEGSFKELFLHPHIIKKIREKVAAHWIMTVVFILGFISGSLFILGFFI